MKIAHFSPLPPERTGVADYCWELLPELARHAQIDIWSNRGGDTSVPHGCGLVEWRDPAGLSDQLSIYDATIYHLGNSSFHEGAYRAFLEHPGVVVMHDFVLHNFFAGCLLAEAPGKYVEEMEYNYGPAGRAMAQNLLAGRIAPLWETQPIQFPLNKRILDLAAGVIVHSDFSKRLVLETHAHLPVKQINFPCNGMKNTQSTAELKRCYGLPSDRLIIASFGMGTPHKRIATVLDAIGRLKHRNLLYLLVGDLTDSIRTAIQESGLEDFVRPTGYVTAEAFEDYCSITDICVNLRYPTYGETSASLCKLMGSAKACIVSDIGWFSELPDDCVAKIEVDEYEEETLLAWLDRLISNAALRLAMGSNAQKYMRTNHSLSSTAVQYVDFLSEVNQHTNRRHFDRRLVEGIADKMARLGITDRDLKLIEGPAKALAQLL